VLYIDLDEFGAVNKNLGQETGDKVLQNVANRLKSSIRKTDTAARVGGDEFVVVLQEVRKREDAEEVAKKIIRDLAQPIHTDEKDCVISASIGISIYPYDGLDNNTLRKKADKAMHQVKKAGKNHYMFCDFPEDDSAEAEPEDRSEEAAFQPLISTGEVFYDRLTFTNSPLIRYRNFAALLYVEADSFEYMNEMFGYDAGNRIFKEVASRLKRSVLHPHTLARIGKDKFVIILEHIQKKQDAEEVAKIILHTLNEPIRVNGKSCVLHVSIGISIYPYDGLDNTTLLKKADQAIREKKDFESTYYFCDFSTESLESEGMLGA
jgi:diguanylate cyclase (GGDEF)-like protein